MPSAFSNGDTAWVLASSALVLLMTPGLAFFYGGMVRAKSVLNMLMMNFIAIAVVTILWVLYGWSVSFGNVGSGDGSGNGFWGGLHQWALHDIGQGFGSGTGGSLLRRHRGADHRGRLLPADVRDHHPGADLRVDGRPHQVRRLDRLRRRAG